MLGDLNTDIKSQNPRSQQVAELLMEFGLVYIRHHLGRPGSSDTFNIVSDATRHVFAENMCIHLWYISASHQRGGNKVRE